MANAKPLLGAGGLRDLARTRSTPSRTPTKPTSDKELANRGDQIRNNFDHHDCFNKDWWDRHRDCWRAAAWAAAAYSAYSYPSWGYYSDYSGYTGDPVYYNYGSNVVYQGNDVYVDGESAGNQQDYAQRAATIAQTGQQAAADPEDNWLTLGVFAMTQGEHADGNQLLQLAVNKSGVIRGNYYKALTDATHPVYGSVDSESQRAAWTIGARKDPTFETGVANLTRPQTTMLVHFGPSSTQQWTLVRIALPDETQMANLGGPPIGGVHVEP